MRAFAMAAAIAIAAGVAGPAAADDNTIPVSVTVPHTVYMGDSYVISVTTAPHALCVGTIILPSSASIVSQASTGWKVPRAADDQGHLAVRIIAGSLRGPRQVIVTCTAEGKKGVGSASYYIQ